MPKARVIRGVWIRGTPQAEGAIVELSPQEFGELKTWNYVVAVTDADLAPAKADAPKRKKDGE
jgi:hypothetical protein